jgi:hypothetical protein
VAALLFAEKRYNYLGLLIPAKSSYVDPGINLVEVEPY